MKFTVSPKQQNASKVLIGVTGASGSIYADRLVQILSRDIERVYLVFSETAEKVSALELAGQKDSILMRVLKGELTKDEKNVIRIFKNDDLFAPVASGSSAPDAMVIVPGSMGALGRIAHGISSSLLERSADVMLKHKKKLIFCPRETPFSLIHLRNMTVLAEAGAELIPLMPAFYQKPKTIEDLVDFCVGRILEQLGITHDLYVPWNSRLR